MTKPATGWKADEKITTFRAGSHVRCQLLLSADLVGHPPADPVQLWREATRQKASQTRQAADAKKLASRAAEAEVGAETLRRQAEKATAKRDEILEAEEVDHAALDQAVQDVRAAAGRAEAFAIRSRSLRASAADAANAAQAQAVSIAYREKETMQAGVEAERQQLLARLAEVAGPVVQRLLELDETKSRLLAVDPSTFKLAA